MSNALEAEWSQIDWAKAQLKVIKLQTKIFEASKSGNKPLVVSLQKTLISSYSARLLAVRRVTQDHRGKKTAGVDGVSLLTPAQRLALAQELQLDGKAEPLKRVLIPIGKSEARPLGIPTIRDRAKQALAKLALEPEWEAVFEANSYGFRLGRSCHDAIEAIELSVRRRTKYVLNVDLRGCFDKLDYHVLIGKIKTYPVMEHQIRAWLKSGVLEGEVFYEPKQNTPQSGVISPLLANIALHGFETYISSQFPIQKTRKGQLDGMIYEKCEARVIRYAHDVVIIHEDLEVVQAALELTHQWMAKIGLNVNELKTKICHTMNELNGEKAGFDFLGFNIRSFVRGQYNSGMRVNGKKLFMVTKVKPSKQSEVQFNQELKVILERGHQQKPEDMIKSLNWFIRGWGNYFKTGSHSHETFGKLQWNASKLYLNWGRKKFSQRGDGYIAHKIFFKSQYQVSHFGWKAGDQTHLVVSLYEMEYQKHVKVFGDRSPYDGDWLYWIKRRAEHPLAPKDITLGLKKQGYRCQVCNVPFGPEDLIEVHHIDGNRKNNKLSNKALLHSYCHDSVHRRGVETIPPNLEPNTLKGVRSVRQLNVFGNKCI